MVRLRLQRLWRVPAKILRSYERDGFTLSVYGIWLKTNWRDATFELCATGRWGFKLFDELTRAERTAFVFVDVGANIGGYSLVASKSNNCEAVYSVEPNPFVADQIRENKTYNKDGKIQVLQCAISSSAGKMSLYFREAHTGMANLERQRKDGHSVVVDVRDKEVFDEIAERHDGSFFFVKVDVEGAEPQVIRQLVASKMSNRVTSLFVEMSPKWVASNEISYIFDAAMRMGLRETWRSWGQEQYDVLFERSRGESHV